MNKLLRWVLGLLFLAAGLVFAATLLAAVVVLAAFWLARGAWARLTGRPVTPWVMGRVDPRAAWTWSTQRARGGAAQPPARQASREIADVTDVEAKPPKD